MVIYVSRPRGNPVYEGHRQPSMMWLTNFTSCPAWFMHDGTNDLFMLRLKCYHFSGKSCLKPSQTLSKDNQLEMIWGKNKELLVDYTGSEARNSLGGSSYLESAGMSWWSIMPSLFVCLFVLIETSVNSKSATVVF